MDWDWDDGPPQDTPEGAPRDDRRPTEEPPPGDAPDSPSFADAIDHFDRSAPPPDDDDRTQLIEMPPDSAAPGPAGPTSPSRDLERPSPGAIERVRRGTPASAPAAYPAGPEPTDEQRPRPPRDRAARARRRKQVRRRRLVALAVIVVIVVLIIVLVVRGCGGSGAPSSALAIGALFVDRRLLAATRRR